MLKSSSKCLNKTRIKRDDSYPKSKDSHFLATHQEGLRTITESMELMGLDSPRSLTQEFHMACAKGHTFSIKRLILQLQKAGQLSRETLVHGLRLAFMKNQLTCVLDILQHCSFDLPFNFFGHVGPYELSNPWEKYKHPQNHVVILTYRYEKTMGDVYFAKRLAKQLAEQGVTVHVLISSHERIEVGHLKDTENIRYKVVPSFSKHIIGADRHLTLERIRTAREVIIAPTIQKWKPVKLLALLRLNPRVRALTEYNYQESSKRYETDSKLIPVQLTGFNHAGVFVDTMDSPPISAVSDRVKQLFKEKTGHELESNQPLSRNHQWFFAYSNLSIESQCDYGIFNLLTFYHFVYALAEKQGIKEVTLLANYDDITRQSFRNYAQRTNSNFHSSQKCLVIQTSQVTIRIVDPFPLTNDDMRALIEHAHPVCLGTGDQSFVEQLMQNKLVCYQIMGWKDHLYANMLQCIHGWGQSLELSQFYANQYLEEDNPPQFLRKRAERIEALAELVHNFYEPLIKQASCFREALEEKGSLDVKPMPSEAHNKEEEQKENISDYQTTPDNSPDTIHRSLSAKPG